jgi:hypothetical protein
VKPSWDLLIATIPHRHASLLELLACLDRQLTWPEFGGEVGVLLYRDNLSVAYGDKTRNLLEASGADYVSCIDDDDLLAGDGVPRVCAALRTRPDYVGFSVGWTKDGVPQLPVEHSLRHPAWENREDALLRSVMQFNPIRREIALDGRWEGGYEAERRWQAGVLAAGRCKEEAWVAGPPVYLYREKTADTFKTHREPWGAADIPPLPVYPWLTVLKTPESC